MSDVLVKLIVDADKCIGSGMCEMLEEETFRIDEDTNIAEVMGQGLLPQKQAAIVIDRCPASAISIA
jgi:ferredoxin